MASFDASTQRTASRDTGSRCGRSFAPAQCQLAADYQYVNQLVREDGLSRSEVVRTVVEITRRTVTYDAAAVVYRRADGGYALRLTAVDDEVSYFEDASRMPPISAGLLTEAVDRHSPLAWGPHDLDAEPPQEPVPWLPDMRCGLSVPIQSIEGDDACAVIFRRADHGFSEEEQRLSIIVMNLMTGLIQTSILRERILQTKAALDDESREIATMQRRLLPPQIPAVPRLAIAVDYETSGRAGGDYYDFFPLEGDRLGVFIADVSGHGSAAAVVMAMTRALLHADPDPPWPPEQVLNRLNAKLHQQMPGEQFVTAFYGVIDPQQNKLTYACAGHPPPWICRRETRELVGLDELCGVPLAVLDDPQYAGTEVPISPGDFSVWFTDGLTEVFNKQGQMFGMKGVERTLGHCPLETADEILAHLQDAADAFAGNPVRTDDRTVIVVKVGD